MNCTHPDHNNSESCEDRAISCHKDCDCCSGVRIDRITIFENFVNNKWLEVSEYIWKSWTGLRRKDGVDYHGPVYDLGTDDVCSPNQQRVCECHICSPKLWEDAEYYYDKASK